MPLGPGHSFSLQCSFLSAHFPTEVAPSSTPSPALTVTLPKLVCGFPHLPSPWMAQSLPQCNYYAHMPDTHADLFCSGLSASLQATVSCCLRTSPHQTQQSRSGPFSSHTTFHPSRCHIPTALWKPHIPLFCFFRQGFSM